MNNVDGSTSRAANNIHHHDSRPLVRLLKKFCLADIDKSTQWKVLRRLNYINYITIVTTFTTGFPHYFRKGLLSTTEMLFLLFITAYAQPAPDLCAQINEERAIAGLPALIISDALTYVAETHRRDQNTNYRPGALCSDHSWNDNSPYWTGCCYEMSRPNTQCMFVKPAELTPFGAVGFEISAYGCGTVSCVLGAWLRSPSHAKVIFSPTMRSVGCAVSSFKVSCCWFSRDADPLVYPGCFTRALPPIPNDRESRHNQCVNTTPTVMPTTTHNPTVMPTTQNPTVMPTQTPKPTKRRKTRAPSRFIVDLEEE